MSDYEEARQEAMSDALSEANGEEREKVKDEVQYLIEQQLMRHVGQNEIEKVLNLLMKQVENL